jgi:LysR family cys regulon transcriptional activator
MDVTTRTGRTDTVDLQKLRGFYWTAHYGSISRAARRIHVSQSAVSHQLKALETELGARLHERTRRGVTLTPEGELLLGYAHDVVRCVEDLQQEFADRRGRPTGTVSLAAFRGITVYTLPDIVHRFHTLYPEVRLVVSSKSLDSEILRLTAAGDVDLGITSSWNEFADLDYLESATYEMYACTARNHPWVGQVDRLSLQDLAEHPLLLYEQGTAIRTRIDTVFSRHDIEPDVVLEAGGWRALIEYVKRGLGVGIVSGLVLAESRDPDLCLFPVSRLFGRLGYGFVMRTGHYLSSAVRAFLDVAGVSADRLPR